MFEEAAAKVRVMGVDLVPSTLVAAWRSKKLQFAIADVQVKPDSDLSTNKSGEELIRSFMNGEVKQTVNRMNTKLGFNPSFL